VELIEILSRLKEYRTKLRKGWPWMLLGAVVFIILMLWYASSKPTIYIAKTLFHPEGKTMGGGQDNALSLILGSGAEGGEAGVMVGVLESRRISESVTADSIEYHGQKRLMADVVLAGSPQFFNLQQWIKVLLADTIYPLSKEQKVIWSARSIRSSMSTEITPEGFIQMNIGFYTPELAGIISREYISKLRAYYKQQRTEKAWKNVQFFTSRADSIKRELDAVSRALARFSDRNQGLVYSESRLSQGEKQMQQEILSQMYISLILSKEQAMAQFQQDIPIIQVLDNPDPPYDKLEVSYLLYFFLGLIGGAGLVGAFLVRRMLREDIENIIREQLLRPSKEAEEEVAEEEADEAEA